MKTIPLTQGMVALVDDEDFDIVAGFKWHALRRPNGLWHAVRTVRRHGIKRSIYMHRVIAGAAAHLEVDHRDGDGLNNRRGNIRIATKRQNAQNRRQRGAWKTSRFKGVSWNEPRRRWRVVIAGGPTDARGYARQIYVGVFRDEVIAAHAYDRAALEHFGDFAFTNFPKEQYGAHV